MKVAEKTAIQDRIVWLPISVKTAIKALSF